MYQFRLAFEYLMLGRREHAVETPQYGQRQNDVLVLASLEAVANQIRDAPDKADDFTVVHRYAP